MTKPDPHPWHPKDDRCLTDALETDRPGLLVIGIAMLVGLALAAAGLLAGLIYGGIALWHLAAQLLT